MTKKLIKELILESIRQGECIFKYPSNDLKTEKKKLVVNDLKTYKELIVEAIEQSSNTAKFYNTNDMQTQ